MIVTLVALGAMLGAPAGLTWVGQRRRGSGRGVASLAAVFFPVAWTVWYVADEHPYGAS